MTSTNKFGTKNQNKAQQKQFYNNDNDSNSDNNSNL